MSPQFSDTILNVIDTSPYNYGDTVSFVITTFNQGSIPVSDIVVNDYVPSGFSYIGGALNDEWSLLNPENTNWSETYRMTIDETILPGGMFMDTIHLRLEQTAGGVEAYTNMAEVAMFSDTSGLDRSSDDLDSASDDDPTNDGGGLVNSDSDDVVEGDGSGMTGDDAASGDEDNADPALVEVVDFALKKYISSPTGPYAVGDTITFDIVIYNQGNVSGKDFLIYDTAPSHLEFIADAGVNPGWSGSPLSSYRHMPTILPGDSDTIQISHIILAGGTDMASYTNVAEIGEVFDANNVEISEEDVDSTPDNNAGNDAGGEAGGDTDDTISGENGDEDDSDPAFVRLVDMALTKEVVTMGPYGVGDVIEFQINLINQGNITTDSIEVNDYVPSGFSFDMGLNPEWSYKETTMYGDTYSTTVGGPILPGSSVSVSIFLTVEEGDGSADQYVNIAEISDFADTNDVSISDEDVDSPSDDDPFNDAGGEVDGDTDDTVDGENGDEDNADPAQIDIVDFALYKTLSSPMGPYGVGDTLLFEINVVNQGTVTGRDIKIYDYIPSGLTYESGAPLNSGWSNTSPPFYTYGSDLLPGDTATVEIQLMINAMGSSSADYTNVAEIGEVFDENDEDISLFDQDSTPDDMPDNDPGGDPNSAADDTIDGDGTGTPGDGVSGTDEDDSDPAFVELVDLALLKTVVDGSPYAYGDTISFVITTINQGSIPMTDVVIQDYVPAGYSYDQSLNAGWMSAPTAEWAETYSHTIEDTIYPGGLVQDTIHLILEMTTGGADAYTNIAEIAMMSDTSGMDRSMDDVDSPTDGDPFNDAGGEVDGDTDDTVDGENGDEDNSDPAKIEVIDFALIKTISTAAPYAIGDTITYAISIINQGNVIGENFEIYDFAPIGLSFINSPFVNPGWSSTAVSGGTYSTYNYRPSISPGDTAVVEIRHIVTDAGVDADDYKNIAEISSFDDEEGDPILSDIDSTPDGNPSDPGADPATGTDDTVNNENGDEDDHDPAIVELVDMALTKMVVTEGPYAVGDTIEFAIEVFNQGNIEMDSIVVNDYVPSGYTFDNSGTNAAWTMVNDSLYQTELTGGILPKDSATVSIYLVINAVSADADQYLNIAELSSFEDTDGDDRTLDDQDSEADDVPDNDGGGEEGSDADDTVDGEGTGDGGPADPATDEDDSDPARIDIVDFALTKSVSSPMAPFAIGDTITFDITVYNQGTVTGENIVIYDHAPVGLTFESSLNPIWLEGSTADSTVYAGPLAPLDSATVQLRLVVNNMGVGIADYTNYAEIGSVEDEEGNDISDADQDSTPDDDPTDDAGGDPDGETDGEVDGDGSGDPDSDDPLTDEDDHDPAIVEIVDMALTKMVVTEGPYAVGDTIEFAIEVFNQGNIEMDSIVVNDYVPSGYTFDNSGTNAAWTMVNDSLYQTELTGGILPKDSATVSIYLVINAVSAEADQYLNIAELSSFEDAEGDDRTLDDQDSEADDVPDNDGGGEEGSDADDTVDGDGTGDGGPTDPATDEDDSDPARIEIVDFALTKSVSSPMAPFAIGDTITFDITVYNQGTVTGENIVIYDHAPVGFTFESSLNPMWLEGATADSTVYAGPLAPLDSATVQLRLVVNNMGVAIDDYTNYAEIGSVEDEEGNDISDADQDSTPDDDPTDDAGGEPDGETDGEVDGDGSGDPDSDDPLTDEDDHDPAIVEIVDMALTKMVVTEGPYAVGDTIEFAIEVFNQGNIEMDSIVVNDYVPSGYTFDNSGTNAAWTMVNDSLYQTELTGGILPKDSATVSIYLVINAVSADADQYLNIAELSSFEDTEGDDRTLDDQDSEADDIPDNDGGGEEGSDADDTVDGDGTGDGGPTDPATDEDDSDPARIDIVDFALTKSVSSPMAPFAIGDTITFDITVYNQGTVTGENIVIYDHAPIGFTFESTLNPMWLEGSTADSTVYAGPLAPLDSATVQLRLVVNNMGVAIDDYTNYAEIGNVEDEEGNDISDADQDSTPDDDPTDDAGGDPDGETDGEVDGDGSGDPDSDDPLTDEDDHDPAIVEIVDMALTKMVVTEGPYAVGDTIEFAIEVFNQGNIEMDSIVVNDYVPSGYTFDNSGTNAAWTMVNDSLYQTELTGGILPKDSATVSIYLVINAVSADADQYLNIAELSSFEDTEGDDRTLDDQDSEADDVPDNDGGGEEGSDADDTVDGDGTGDGGPADPATDEDDSDPARIDIVDFALTKSVSSPMAPFAIGDTITFDITVYNQGTVTGTDFVIYDHAPIGFTYVQSLNTGWTNASGLLSYDYAGPLAPMESDIVQIQLIVNGSGSTNADYTNIAEIGSVEDEEGNDISDDDQDSTPDDDPTDDAGGDPDSDSDNEIDGDGSGEPGDEDGATDEDDSDPAFIRIVDLALTKMVITELPYRMGDTIEFLFTTLNQGNVPVSNVVLNDYVPEGFEFDGNLNPGWMFLESTVYGDTYIKTITENVYPDIPRLDTIRLRILELDSVYADMYTNIGEIGGFTDTSGVDITSEDVDSPSDDDPFNDKGGEPEGDTDDTVDGENDDEDNSDPAVVGVVDFALKKVVVTEGPYFQGDLVNYEITIYNQGNVTGHDIVIHDYTPSGLDFINDQLINPGWMIDSTGYPAFTYAGPLVTGDSASVNINMRINGSSALAVDYVNVAEIGEVIGSDGIDIGIYDVDSKPDSEPVNDAGGESGGLTDDTINNEEGDEDDADPAPVCMSTFLCSEDVSASSCRTQDVIDSDFSAWLDGFVAEGCGVVGTFENEPLAPDACGGSVTVKFIISQDGFVLDSCSATYNVLFDNDAPTCPVDFDITFDITESECMSPAYQSIAELESGTTGEVSDNCTADANIIVDWYDAIVPLECTTPGASYFDQREVIRTYTFTDACGNTSELCPQTITYNISECNQLSNYGKIAINGELIAEIPEGCDVPMIGESEAAQGSCGSYIEYMWLVSTEERPGTNLPYIPNDLNIGVIWFLVEGANEATYDPGVITENTYYVRCARDFSCCGYGESNLVGYRINNANQCPVIEEPVPTIPVVQNCDEAISLTAEDNNVVGNQDVEYQTNMTIDASNTIGAGSNIIYNAKTSTILMPGFEVQADGILEVKTDGCSENE